MLVLAGALAGLQYLLYVGYNALEERTSGSKRKAVAQAAQASAAQQTDYAVRAAAIRYTVTNKQDVVGAGASVYCLEYQLYNSTIDAPAELLRLLARSGLRVTAGSNCAVFLDGNVYDNVTHQRAVFVRTSVVGRISATEVQLLCAFDVGGSTESFTLRLRKVGKQWLVVHDRTEVIS